MKPSKPKTMQSASAKVSKAIRERSATSKRETAPKPRAINWTDRYDASPSGYRKNAVAAIER